MTVAGRRVARWACVSLICVAASVAFSACNDTTQGRQAAAGTSSVSLPRNGLSAATLDLQNGSTQIDVATGPLTGELLRVTTPAGGGQAPSLTVSGSVVTVGLDTVAGGSGVNHVTLGLEAAVLWTIRINGGTTTLTVDTSAGGLRELDLMAGASQMAVTLGVPVGTVGVTVTGGAGALTVRRPTSIPIRVRGNGVGSLMIDGSQQSSNGSVNAATSDWDAASARYDVDIESGVGAVTIERTGG
jgi:hypothetical protein